ncbi:MAG: choice-of-anchor J domain-containing protein [Candidatus Cloacimonetes bacterium]|nr:choice-of-anchor J domain-containing protein [Candidatus Cloacimonadota bacterium]
MRKFIVLIVLSLFALSATLWAQNPPTNLAVSVVSETEALFSWSAPTGGGGEIDENFDADALPDGWIINDNDGDGYNWEVSQDWGGNNNSTHCMTSASYRNDVGALFPDNWLISPALAVGGTSELHFWVAAQDPSWAAEQYYVKVSTTGDQISDFTNTIHSQVLSTDVYMEVVVSLADYAGQTIYLAWQHADVTDMFWMNLDDISVINTQTREVSFSADFETEKSVRQFKTGNSYKNENYRNRDLTGYDVYLDGTLIDSNIPETESLFGDLEDGETYTAGVAAVYTDGTSELVELVFVFNTGQELPPPTNLSVDLINETEALFSWFAPSGGGGEIDENFDADTLPDGWIINDNDGDGYNWEVSADWGGNNDSAHCMTSASYRNDVGALFPDNWLISPALAVGGTSELHFWVAAQDPAWAAEQYYVKVSTTGDQISDFTNTIHSQVLSTDAYTEVVLSLSEFTGQTIYLAWQHADVTDMFWMNLDDISVINTQTREVSFSADFETAKSVRQFKTGNSYRNENYRDRDLTGYNVYLDGDFVEGNISVTEYLFGGLVDGETYTGGVAAVYTDGISEIVELEFVFNDADEFGINGITTKLNSNYPNPFNPETKINFSTKESGLVVVEVYNVKGQKVKTLVNAEYNAGNHSVIWSGSDDNGNNVVSGIYFYNMKSGRYTATKKMILMK